MQDEHYVIRGGVAGRNRLRVLAEVFGATTRSLLAGVRVPTGATCLDVGCGGGDVTRELARMVGPGGQVTGVDSDEVVLGAAQRETADAGLANAVYVQQDVTSWTPDGRFDVIYGRFIFSHLADPVAVMSTLRGALAPGGVMVVEDIDFRGHFAEPHCPALTRYVDWYSQSVRNRGADPCIGPKLPGFLRTAGFEDVQVQVYHPVALRGGIKHLTNITLENIRGVVLRDDLVSTEEFSATLAELRTFSEDPTTVMGGPRTFQAWARNPGM